MLIKSIEIKNVGPIKYILIEVNKPLTIFYGDMMAGKTKTIESIQLCFGGSFPNDIIHHGETEAHVLIKFTSGSSDEADMAIKRRFWKNKDGITEAELTLVQDMEVKKKPISIIKEFLNPFLLDPEFFNKKNLLDKNRYFLELFNIDQSQYQKQIFLIDKEASDLRSKLKGYGDIDLTPINFTDTEPLYNEKNTALTQYENELKEVQLKNKDIDKNNKNVKEASDQKESNLLELRILKEKIAKLERDTELLSEFIENTPVQETIDLPHYPKFETLDEKIAQATANNAKYEQYLKNIKRDKERQEDKNKIQELTAKKKQIEADNIVSLNKTASDSRIAGLSFDKDGTALYEGYYLELLSESQNKRLCNALSNLYPSGFGLQLLDGAESFGFAHSNKEKLFKAINHYINEAKSNNKIILATVVGDKPAEVPEESDVYVIEDGRIKE